jgi:hypothetical protein
MGDGHGCVGTSRYDAYATHASSRTACAVKLPVSSCHYRPSPAKAPCALGISRAKCLPGSDTILSIVRPAIAAATAGEGEGGAKGAGRLRLEEVALMEGM